MVAMRAVAAVWSIIVALLLAWWATGIAINGSATLSTPWPLIVMASLGALIIAGGILSRRSLGRRVAIRQPHSESSEVSRCVGSSVW
jgi:hypothetical protein